MKTLYSSRALLIALLFSIVVHACVFLTLPTNNKSASLATPHVVNVTIKETPIIEPDILTPATTPPLVKPQQQETPKEVVANHVPTEVKPSPPIEEKVSSLSKPLPSKTPATQPKDSITLVDTKPPVSTKPIESVAVQPSIATDHINEQPSTASIPSMTRPAKIIRKVSPEYPKKARRRELEGTVILVATISAQGRIEALHLDQSSGHSILDNAATDAVKKWAFEPALIAGQPTSTSLAVPVRFSLTAQ